MADVPDETSEADDQDLAETFDETVTGDDDGVPRTEFDDLPDLTAAVGDGGEDLGEADEDDFLDEAMLDADGMGPGDDEDDLSPRTRLEDRPEDNTTPPKPAQR